MICVSTGVFWKIFPNKNDGIEIIKGAGADGIELMFNDKESFNLDVKRLKGFDYISIHSPNVKYISDLKTNRILRRLNKFAIKVNAKNIIFHTDNVEDSKPITKYKNFTACIENDDHNIDTMPIVRKMLSEEKKLMFCFDFAHAYKHLSYSTSISKMIDGLENRIKEFHVSLLVNNKHDFIHRSPMIEDVKNELKAIIKLKKPIIIESTIQKKEDVYLLAKEIEFLKAL